MFDDISMYKDVHGRSAVLLLRGYLQSCKKLKRNPIRLQEFTEECFILTKIEQTDMQADSKLTTTFFPFSEGGTLPGW